MPPSAVHELSAVALSLSAVQPVGFGLLLCTTLPLLSVMGLPWLFVRHLG